MRIGTKSVLFGAHCFFIHPFFVAAAWWRLYGFPFDPRLWVAFFIHDLGYVGKPNMDGDEGERHPEWAAKLMARWFDGIGQDGLPKQGAREPSDGWKILNPVDEPRHWLGHWGSFTLFHSRFYSKRLGFQYSRLCVADKLSVALEPWWLYLPRVVASGEINEYMSQSRSSALGRDKLPASKYSHEPQCTERSEVEGLSYRRAWHRVMTNYCRKWALTHRDGDIDTWTNAQTTA